MHILQVHNQYKNRGGEEVVVDMDKKFLENNGIKVSRYLISNQQINSIYEKFKAGFNLVYSLSHKNEIKKIIKECKPDVVHVHNFFPLITPSVFYACSELKVPVVFTVHNYRLLCINGLLYRENKVCEKCLSQSYPWSGLANNCYRDSKLTSLMPFITTGYHKTVGTWNRKVDKFLFLSEFSKDVFQRAKIKIDENKMVVKSNFTEDRGYDIEKEDYFVFIGRLSEEKGINTILEAFAINKQKLIIMGSGPLDVEVARYTKEYSNIIYKGFVPSKVAIEHLKKARAMVFASRWYEGMPMVILESFSCATPVITSDVGNGASMIRDAVNGFKFKVDDVASLNESIERLNKSDNKTINLNARQEFLAKYQSNQNINQLITIYKDLISNKN